MLEGLFLLMWQLLHPSLPPKPPPALPAATEPKRAAEQAPSTSAPHTSSTPGTKGA
jgi:hypothetical protein